MSRPTRLILFCLAGALLTGGLATLYVASEAPGAIAISPDLVAVGLLAAALTVANLFVRFTRWQFVLRRLDVRVPSVDSLWAFAGSFAFLPVPLLLGQLYARRRLLPEPRPAPADIVLAFVWERWLDAWALLLLSTLALPAGWSVAALLLAGAGLLLPFRLATLRASLALVERISALFTPSPLRFDPRKVETLLSGEVVAAAAAGSLLAWALLGASFATVAATAGTGGSFTALVGSAALGILGGGLSLVPLGAAVSGLILLDQLASFGAPTAAALQAVFVFRVSSAWLTVVLGAVVLLIWRGRSRRPSEAGHDHFDEIDPCYDSWLPQHYRAHLVTRKLGFMRDHLASLGPAPRGLDLGCGRGWYVEGVRSGGARIIGMDLSRRQLDATREYAGAGTPLCQASILAPPFRSGAYDFAYVINVFHHLSLDEQRAGFETVARILRPGGLFFLHEMNVRNPVFRGYLGYVYPILKGIEEGIEHYLDPRRLPVPPSLELVSVDYFTFVPDLCPESLLPLFRGLERRLERSPVAPFAAHFLAVLRRRPEPSRS